MCVLSEADVKALNSWVSQMKNANIISAPYQINLINILNKLALKTALKCHLPFSSLLSSYSPPETLFPKLKLLTHTNMHKQCPEFPDIVAVTDF